MILPKYVKDVIINLRSNHFTAYLVGGCVRDMFINEHDPKDYDITTDATPEEIRSIFKDTYDVGSEFGTVLVRSGKAFVEVTTYRKESYRNNDRKPVCSFTKSLYEDLKRRDFTINSMAYDIQTGKLIDPYNGRKDIERCLIRTVMNPRIVFDDDPLRILRAIRFALKYNFKIHWKTYLWMILKSKNLNFVSKERKRLELEQILKYPSFKRYKLILSMCFKNINFGKINSNKFSFKDSILLSAKYDSLDSVSIEHLNSNIDLRKEELKYIKSMYPYRYKIFRYSREVAEAYINVGYNNLKDFYEMYLIKTRNRFFVDTYIIKHILEKIEANNAQNHISKCLNIEIDELSKDIIDTQKLNSIIKSLVIEYLIGNISNDKESIYGFLKNKNLLRN